MRAIDLQKFCSEDETREPLMKPWRDGDFTYASDGRVIIKVPAEPGDVVQPKTPTPEKVAIIFSWFNGPGLEWQKLPTLPVLETQGCGVCHGDGEHECDCGCVHKCGNCDGVGKIPIDAHLDIGPARFNCYYLRLIADLPGLEIAVRGELDPMMLRFDGGVGVLMPMRKDVPWAERASKS